MHTPPLTRATKLPPVRADPLADPPLPSRSITTECVTATARSPSMSMRGADTMCAQPRRMYSRWVGIVTSERIPSASSTVSSNW
ncbi:hypothetical protein [Microbacterium sp. Se63.02b]|uniref:hypothetical protein n=1 Tax=Microbacterium sp. Se63.02b TaxID=2709304 RepID=UPI0019210BA5|nr:hypothetical protein [Microbacterium sp. Se63.02b]